MNGDRILYFTIFVLFVPFKFLWFIFFDEDINLKFFMIMWDLESFVFLQNRTFSY